MELGMNYFVVTVIIKVSLHLKRNLVQHSRISMKYIDIDLQSRKILGRITLEI